MSLFEPQAVFNTIKASLEDGKKRKEFEVYWNEKAAKRLKVWMAHRENQSRSTAQLGWEASIVAYVSWVHEKTSVHGNAAAGTKPAPLNSRIPILGPRFVPPTYLSDRKRHSTAAVAPESSYLKPLNVVHPFYYPELAACPQCGSKNVLWDDWTATGHREVHGIRAEETALGYQLRCNECKVLYSKKKEKGEKGGHGHQYCFATTSEAFWERWEYWAIPKNVPVFFKRCALTRELFDLVVEMRPALTSKGLAEHINQLHLLEYQQTHLQYLRMYKTREVCLHTKEDVPLKAFSGPRDPNGYADQSITSDLISDVLLEFSKRTREAESAAYMRTLTGICISLDNTFKVVKKATVADKHHHHDKLMKGGILSVINERNEIISWRLCQNKSNAEIDEILQGIRQRCAALETALPEMVVVDNCCTVRGGIVKALDESKVVLDVWHFMMRCVWLFFVHVWGAYLANDVVDAILKRRAKNGVPALYHTKEEQEKRLTEMYNKWRKTRMVWSQAAAKTHQEQLKHVRKGCLTRTREDIASDGSRIEGTHKGWNSLMRSFSSGLEIFVALGHDFVLRRNIRLAFSALSAEKAVAPTFLTYTYGSHHIQLTDHIAELWNAMLGGEHGPERGPATTLIPRPRLANVDSGESFGLVSSQFALTYGGLMEFAKPEEEEMKGTADLLERVSEDEEAQLALLRDMNIDPCLLNIPETPPDALPETNPPLSLPKARGLDGHQLPARSGSSFVQEPTTAASSSMQAASSQNLHARVSSRTIEIVDLTKPDITISETTDTLSLRMSTNSTSAVPDPKSGSLKRKAVRDDENDRAGSVPKKVCTVKGVVPVRSTAEQPVGTAIELFFKPLRQTQSDSDANRSASSGGGGRGAAALSGGATRAAGSDVQASIPAPDPSSAALHPETETSTMTGLQLPIAFPPAMLPLITRLPLPPTAGLSRSQALFERVTRIDPRALKIGDDQEFFVFMDLRLQHRWATFSMTSRNAVTAAELFNAAMKAHNDPRGVTTVKKNPSAIIEKLNRVEEMIVKKIKSGNYKSRNGNEAFWRTHCKAVPLANEEKGKKARKPKSCNRCLLIKYSGGVGAAENHRLNYCPDGVKIVADEGDPGPGYPQPEGLFTEGDKFNPNVFLTKLRELYDQLVVRGETIESVTSTMEGERFIELVRERVKVHADDFVGFKLYQNTTLVPDMPGFVEVRNGHPWLRVDCLSDAKLQLLVGEN
ncbi:hypothetical protein BV25DRAFT_1912599 [Artomyces pyxidatus]|uniref:Uncharacterized protein n=1 Tax=Artomyces pyxidatus TaxID=48021 RepID=A0ACB8TDP2_9AGAM|nr:hypothetical protein BV25DRAFT_1912599 [Artomyces pyxidatus]